MFKKHTTHIKKQTKTFFPPLPLQAITPFVSLWQRKLSKDVHNSQFVIFSPILFLSLASQFLNLPIPLKLLFVTSPKILHC